MHRRSRPIALVTLSLAAALLAGCAGSGHVFIRQHTRPVVESQTRVDTALVTYAGVHPTAQELARASWMHTPGPGTAVADEPVNIDE